jgi:hypothetical protein
MSIILYAACAASAAVAGVAVYLHQKSATQAKIASAVNAAVAGAQKVAAKVDTQIKQV